jgi:hypothetical protein
VDGGHHRTDLVAEHLREGADAAQNRGHVDPQLTEGCRNLAADESHADNDRVAPWNRHLFDGVAVGARAQSQHPGKSCARDRQASIAAAGGQQQPIEGDALARVAEDDLARLQVDRLHSRAQALDVVLPIPVRRLDRPRRPVLLAAQVRLGQGRTAERFLRLVPDQHHAFPISLLAQGGCRVTAAQTGADDHDARARHLRSGPGDHLRRGSPVRGARAHG